MVTILSEAKTKDFSSMFLVREAEAGVQVRLTEASE